MAKSLLHMISNDIGQLACLHAKLHGLDRVYFGGFFIRGHPVTMRTITYSINFFSKVIDVLLPPAASPGPAPPRRSGVGPRCQSQPPMGRGVWRWADKPLGSDSRPLPPPSMRAWCSALVSLRGAARHCQPAREAVLWGWATGDIVRLSRCHVAGL